MGQKIHPVGLRLGITQKHKSQWITRANITRWRWLLQDKALRTYLFNTYENIEKVKIFREQTGIDRQTLEDLHIIKVWIYAEDPFKICSNEEQIEKLAEELRQFCKKNPSNWLFRPDFLILPRMYSVPAAEHQAYYIANQLIKELESRTPFRRALKKVVRSLTPEPKRLDKRRKRRNNKNSFKRNKKQNKKLSDRKTLLNKKRQSQDFAEKINKNRSQITSKLKNTSTFKPETKNFNSQQKSEKLNVNVKNQTKNQTKNQVKPLVKSTSKIKSEEPLKNQPTSKNNSKEPLQTKPKVELKVKTKNGIKIKTKQGIKVKTKHGIKIKFDPNFVETKLKSIENTSSSTLNESQNVQATSEEIDLGNADFTKVPNQLKQILPDVGSPLKSYSQIHEQTGGFRVSISNNGDTPTPEWLTSEMRKNEANSKSELESKSESKSFNDSEAQLANKKDEKLADQKTFASSSIQKEKSEEKSKEKALKSQKKQEFQKLSTKRNKNKNNQNQSNRQVENSDTKNQKTSNKRQRKASASLTNLRSKPKQKKVKRRRVKKRRFNRIQRNQRRQKKRKQINRHRNKKSLAFLKGVKIQLSGRLNGAEIARSEWYKQGRVPLQTLRAYVDYVSKTAKTPHGILGIKVWTFKGERR